MIDDSAYEYLSISIIQYFSNNLKNNSENALHSLDYLGYRVGYNLIERYQDDQISNLAY
jgi:hypothetical protein